MAAFSERTVPQCHGGTGRTRRRSYGNVLTVTLARSESRDRVNPAGVPPALCIMHILHINLHFFLPGGVTVARAAWPPGHGAGRAADAEHR
jgi:hypothetical protein